MEELKRDAMALKETLVAHRRWLHKHAEVGFGLEKTVGYVKKALAELGCQPKDCGRGGVVVTLGRERAAGAYLLRADMDALPIREESGLSFASENGCCHACGHDMHTAMLLGAAALLKKREGELPRAVKLLFQPAEETLEGAADCVASGVLEEPRVCGAAMLHVMTATAFPAGTVVLPSGGVNAPASDFFEISVRGRACHGSAPQNGVDAIGAAAHILLSLQSLTARETSTHTHSVLTVGRFLGGHVGNAIADTARMEGTLRSLDVKTQAFLKERVEEVGLGLAAALRADATVRWLGGCPPLQCDAAECRRIGAFLKKNYEGAVLFPEELGTSLRARNGGSEDFAAIAARVPSVMLALAAGEEKAGYRYPLHHPCVTFDENALPHGALLLSLCALAGQA